MIKQGADRQSTAQNAAQALVAADTAAVRVIQSAEAGASFNDLIDVPGLRATLRAQAAAVQAGDLATAEAMLIGQASALQSLWARLVEQAMVQTYLPQMEALMRLALRAQSQCRATLETLAMVKHPPVVIAKQANFAQQQLVSNGVARTPESQVAPNELSGRKYELSSNPGASSLAGGIDSTLEAMGALDRSAIGPR